MKAKRKPTHPGIFFRSEVLEERGISVTDAAAYLGVTRKALSEFVNGKAKCSHAMARRLAESTETGVAFWINMQAKLDTWEAENMEVENVSLMPTVKVA